MRRTTVYPGAVPLELDLLNTNKQTMISVGHVLQDMLGTGTLFSGLGCVPTGPAGMTVNVNPGRAYSLQSTDTGAYSSLAADAHPIMKQGILLDLVNFACPAPTTAGFSQNYLIEGAFQEVDGGSVVLPYYNAANPAVAFSGPNGAGTSNTTYRDNTVQLQLKPGAAATTGSQVTPTPDSGFTGLWVVTVAFGQVTITSTSIAQYAGAPFLTAPLLTQIQQFSAHGQCVLSSGGTTNLTLFPMNGNNLIINGVTQQIPAGGVSYTLTGTSAGNTYNVYAFMSAGVMALMLSATGHSTAPNGVETMTGDTTKTLVGKVYTSAVNTLLDNGTNRTIISWFNRRMKAINTGSVGNSTSSLTSVLLGLTVTFIAWSADSFQAQLSGIANNSTVNDGASIGILLDGAGGAFTSSQIISNPASSSQTVCSISAGSLAEGVHTLQAQGAALTGGNATFNVTFIGLIFG